MTVTCKRDTAGSAIFGPVPGRLEVATMSSTSGPTGRDLLAALPATSRADRVLRISRPDATVAFGRLDTLRPGYEEAAERAIRHGFTPVVRNVGGHAAAYDHGCVVVELTGRDDTPRVQTMARLAGFAQLLGSSLRRLGVAAGVGALPDEYCPGRHSVNARGATKLVGTAQRVTTSGWMLSAVVTVSGVEQVRAVVTDVYAALALPFDPVTLGCVADELGHGDFLAVEEAVIATFREAAPALDHA